MFTLEILVWFFEASGEDGMLPTLLGAAIEALIAISVPLAIYKLTDLSEVKNAINDLSLRLADVEEYVEAQAEE